MKGDTEPEDARARPQILRKPLSVESLVAAVRRVVTTV